MRDLVSNFSFTELLVPQTLTANTTSNALDLRGFDAATIMFVVGASGDTLSGSIRWTLRVEESDASGSGFAQVPASNLLVNTGNVNVNTGGAASTIYVFGYLGIKRYIRGNIIATGSHSNGTPMSVVGLRGCGERKPSTT